MRAEHPRRRRRIRRRPQLGDQPQYLGDLEGNVVAAVAHDLGSDLQSQCNLLIMIKLPLSSECELMAEQPSFPKSMESLQSHAKLSCMNLAVPKPMTLVEFLAWESEQELRYEFDGVQPVAITGGTFAHASIQRNLALAVGNRLRGKPCEQDRIAATVFARVEGDWIGHVLTEDAILSMPEIGIELPLAELYEGIELNPRQDMDDNPQPDSTSPA